MAPAEFVERYWEREALIINRSESDYFAGLPGLNAIDELITATASHSSRPNEDVRIVKTDRDGVLSEGKVRSTANGVPDIQQIYREYQGGCSVGINHLHRRSASVALLCSMLEADLHHPVGANLYLTPPGAQGLRPHFDTHDVFILQLHGIKEWHVSSPRNMLPLVSMKQNLVELPSDFRKFTLQPGDVLYLPRGFLHYANTEASSSLHLTVRIEVYRWVDFMCEALRELTEDQVEFRNALPPRFFDTPLNSAHIKNLTECLVRSLSNPEFVERAKGRLGTKLLQASKAATTSQFASIDALSDLTIASVVTRSPGQFCRVRRTTKAAVIEFSGNFISGPVSLESTLEFVAEREQFVVGDLPGELSVTDKIDLVVYMVSEGLLQIRH